MGKTNYNRYGREKEKPIVDEVQILVDDAINDIIDEKEKVIVVNNSKFYKVLPTRLNIRKGPDKEAKVLRTVNKDDIIEVEVEINNTWASLKHESGFVMREFLEEV